MNHHEHAGHNHHEHAGHEHHDHGGHDHGAHGSHDHAAHGGHDHSHHGADFRRLFWISLALTIPTLVFSHGLQEIGRAHV
jgi:Cu2+-exporting ATPase